MSTRPAMSPGGGGEGKPPYLARKHAGGPAALELDDGHDGSDGLNEAKDAQRRMLVGWREDVLVEGHLPCRHARERTVPVR